MFSYNHNPSLHLILINLSFSILLIYDYFIYFKYIKQCNDIYPNDVHRLSPNDHHNLYQNRHITSNADQSCIEIQWPLQVFVAKSHSTSVPGKDGAETFRFPTCTTKCSHLHVRTEYFIWPAKDIFSNQKSAFVGSYNFKRTDRIWRLCFIEGRSPRSLS